MTQTPVVPVVTGTGPGAKGNATLFAYAGLGGAFLLLLAFFLPWWGISMCSEAEGEKAMKDMKPEDAMATFAEMGKAVDTAFLESKWSKDEVKKMETKRGKDERFSLTAFGWKFGTGVTGLIFGLLLVGIFLPGRFVPMVAKFEWIGGLVAVVLGLILFIMSLVVIFGTPGKDVPPFFSQGISIGPILVLLASLVTMAAGALFALPNVLALVKKAAAV